MSKTLSIPANEHGLVRVFSLSMGEAEAKLLRTNAAAPGEPSPQELALGADRLNAEDVEVFPLEDLGEMSLHDFLLEGAGVVPKALERDRGKLAALDGWVMIVYSGAFGGDAQEITPDARVTLIGSYPQEGADWTPAVDLTTPSAQPYSGPPPAKKRPSDAAISGRIAMLALLVAFFVVGLMLWVGS